MSHEKSFRIFASEPVNESGLKERWARWHVVAIDNCNKSADQYVVRPDRRVGNRNQPYEIYYHSSIVESLRSEIERLKKGENDDNGYRQNLERA